MQPLTPFDAARILGCTPQEVPALLSGETPTLERVEQVALARYPWRTHVDDPESYWVTVKQAAGVLSVSVQRVKQYLDNEQIPHVVHHSGVRLMRREQLETVANARMARRLRAAAAPAEADSRSAD